MKSPAYIHDLDFLESNAQELKELLSESGCKYLYPLKPCSYKGILETLKPIVDGFEVSSLFEAKLVHKIAPELPTHYTSPGMRIEEMAELLELCTKISCNSLNQLTEIARLASPEKLAFRINPQLSFTGEDRYDPCHASSKLGVPFVKLSEALTENPQLAGKFQGVTFHSVCEQEGFQPLKETLDHLFPLLKKYSDRWTWISLGGGYLFERDEEILYEQVDRLKRLGYEVYMEPGSATVSESGNLLSKVIDIFKNGGQQIAILDSTVNHLPEAYEYQYEYPLKEASASGKYSYTLAGSSCFAGDVLGTYSFESKLSIGDEVHFLDCGAYSLVKAHMFNGLNLPSVYFLRDGNFTLMKEFSFDDFTRGIAK